MSENKVYVLQKDIPNAKAGMRFLPRITIQGHGGYTADNKPSGPWIHFNRNDVEENIEWFLLEEDHEITKAKELLINNGYQFVNNCWFRPVGNGILELKYTEEDLRKAWNSGRDNMNLASLRDSMDYIIESFDDYLKSLNK